jgi:hypothetical protein
MLGFGFTTTLYLLVSPGHPAAPFVIATAAYTTVRLPDVLFINVAGAIVLLPEACAPDIPTGICAVQGILTPGVGEVKVTCCVVCPEQIVWGAGLKLTLGAGFTVIVV